MDIQHYSGADVRRAVSMPAAITAVREAFVALAQGTFEMPTRTALADGAFLMMSVHHAPTRSAMVKTLSLNFDSRRPAIVGTVAWSELDSPVQVVADAAAVTALRTGAVSGVATDLCAPPAASSCTVIGAGAQGIEQARAVHAVRPLSTLTVVDADLARAEQMCSRLAADLPGVEIVVSRDEEGSVEGRDIVCCATPSREPLFRADALAECAHVNAIGSFRPSMRELPRKLLASADIVIVDDLDAVLIESGEVIDALDAGAIRTADLVELGSALQTVQSHTGHSVFKSVGVAVQDWAIARLLASHANAEAN